MKWILILMLHYNGVAVTSVEFESERACRNALAEAKGVWGENNTYAICVSKGDTP